MNSTNPKCSKCRSEKIIPGADMFFLGHNSAGELKLRVGHADPKALLFKVPIYAELNANICGECGYTELVAKNPAALYQEYLESRERQT